MAINFPLKLSFSVTAHKVQGQSIYQPKGVVLDLKKATFAGQANVMLSRAECMDQIIIIDDLYRDKWKLSQEALLEVERMERIALNLNFTINSSQLNIFSLNIRLLKIFRHLLNEFNVRECDIICLQETRYNGQESYQIDGFESHHNYGSTWRGNGIANYFKSPFSVTQTIWAKEFQISKISYETIDVLNVYYKNELESEFLSCLQQFIVNKEHTFILGDFNLDYPSKKQNKIIVWLKEKGFEQIVDTATHIMGGQIDHVWVPKRLKTKVRLHRKSVFFSDHDPIYFFLEM